MKRNDFYEFADERGYQINYLSLPETHSIAMPVGETAYIGMDNDLSSAEETTCLAHELGHCEYGGFYKRTSPLDVLEKHEYHANVWAILRLVPYTQLVYALKQGYTERWELAEYFETTEDFIMLAIEYYRDRKGYNFDL